MAPKTKSLLDYSKVALPHLEEILEKNLPVLKKISKRLIKLVQHKKCLLVFGSGHSSLLAMELYHRAGGPSFVIPLVADYFLPVIAGPKIARQFERLPGAATPLLDRAMASSGEMLWIMSQSGINASVVDLALQAKNQKLDVVAFTSLNHSRSQNSRHVSGKRLYEVCSYVVDIGGVPGDACLPLDSSPLSPSVGPLSSLSVIFLAHSILSHVCSSLEALGISCVYTSVNTAQGEARNTKLEIKQSKRDFLLR